MTKKKQNFNSFPAIFIATDKDMYVEKPITSKHDKFHRSAVRTLQQIKSSKQYTNCCKLRVKFGPNNFHTMANWPYFHWSSLHTVTHNS